jgi:hypothetical protein
MWVKIRQNFNDGRDKFYKNETRWVEDEARAQGFVNNAWAEDLSKPGETGAPKVGSIDLEVQSGQLGMRDTNNG